MEKSNITNFTGGWFIGNFKPSLLQTNDVEVAVKSYKSGTYEERHFHKVATEYTVIVQGKVRMNGLEYISGDIIVIEPNESTDFEAITDVVTVVVKVPGANNDKYLTR
jgi:hypothetical protein